MMDFQKVFGRLLAALFVIFACGVAGTAGAATTMTAAQATSLFASGNAAYRAQKYEEAAGYYKDLIGAGYGTAPVLYNAGTAAARLEKKGEAIGYFLRARKLNPRDENIIANLAKVRQPLTAGQPQTADSLSAESVWKRITGFFTAAEWLAMLWVAVLMLSVGGIVMVVKTPSRIRGLGRALVLFGGVAIVVLAVPGVASIYDTYFVHRSVALSGTSVLSGPAERFTSVATLPEGDVVRRLGRETDGYVQVRLSNGLQGYVKKSVLMKL